MGYRGHARKTFWVGLRMWGGACLIAPSLLLGQGILDDVGTTAGRSDVRQ